jgi:hypothetical protein
LCHKIVKLLGIFTVIVALQWKVIIKGMLENIPELALVSTKADGHQFSLR